MNRETWFIRLGRVNEPHNWPLYQDLAGNHSVIMIGYALDKDITGLTDKLSIQNELEACLIRRNIPFRQAQLEPRARLIHTFINKIQEYDIVISPFERETRKFRIGIIKGDCGTVDSFFQGRQNVLTAIINSHPTIDSRQIPVEVKPARKVLWLTEEINLSDFSAELQKELNKPMLATTNRLKI